MSKRVDGRCAKYPAECAERVGRITCTLCQGSHAWWLVTGITATGGPVEIFAEASLWLGVTAMQMWRGAEAK